MSESIYLIRENKVISCGFTIMATDIAIAAQQTSQLLRLLPFSLYQHIDFKTTSAIIGSLFAAYLAQQVGAIVNPIEKGHPDVIPIAAQTASEAALHNYPQGLEIKTTIGNIPKGTPLKAGQTRVQHLVSLTWQAHHQAVTSLLGLVWDFADSTQETSLYPIITGAFYSDNLMPSDWGSISGLTGRNTKVTGMKSSGKQKLGTG